LLSYPCRAGIEHLFSPGLSRRERRSSGLKVLEICLLSGR
jgi:hypothetical protein